MRLYLPTLCFFVMLMGVQYARAQSTDLVKALAGEYAGDAQVFTLTWEGAKVGPAGIYQSLCPLLQTTPDLTHQISWYKQTKR